MLSIFADAFFVATRTETPRVCTPPTADETSRRRFPRLSLDQDAAPRA